MSETRVAVYPADLGGCGHYRCIWPARALQAEGADIDLVLPNEPQDRHLQAQWFERYDTGTPELVDVLPPDADVVVLQRPITTQLALAVEHLQRHGRRVVVEIDDDFDTIHPRNIAWAAVQPHLSPHKNRRWLHHAAERADMVVVSTPALARRYGSHGRVRVVRNRVPARYLDVVREPQDGLHVGWSGSIETHPDDLQVMGSGLARALRGTGAELAIVGTGKGVRRITGVNHDPLACGWRPLPEYPEAVAQFDVGVVPLAITPFNQAKSWLKGLEYAAVGVPFVASPTDEYLELHRFGLGLIATKPRQWENRLRRLLADPGWREDLAESGREVARTQTIQANAEQWWDAWTASLDRTEVSA